MAEASVPTITIVVPTFRRGPSLDRLLTSLASQDDPGAPWEVVVVDNDDEPGAAPVFTASVLRDRVPARLVREPRRGASHSRNRGMAEAAGRVIVFVDDDVVPARDWLKALVDPVLAGRCDGVGGRVVLDPTVERPAWFDEDGLGVYLAAHDPADVERPLADGEFVITASAAFRTDLLRRTGGMDPELGPRAGVQLVNDDVLLCDRFRDLGGRMHHVPEAVVVHELPADRLRPGYLLRRAYSQGRSDWIYFSRTIGRRGGAHRGLGWLLAQVRARRREGLSRAPVAFHLACDAARAAGMAREIVARARAGFR